MTSPAGYSQVNLQTPEQQGSLQQLLAMLQGGGAQGFSQALQHLMGMLSGDSSTFDAMEAPMKRQFQEEVIPSLQERLTSMGAGGGTSSGAPQVLGQAGARFQEGLASQRAQLQQSAVQQLLNTYLQGTGIGLGTQAIGQQQNPRSWISQLGGGIGGAITGGIQGAPFGPWGASAGASAGGAKGYFG